MKRIIGIVLLLLLLCGCTVPEQNETTIPPQTTLAPTEATEPLGIYVPFSDLEVQTDGAVRYFLPQEENCYGIRMMAGDVLAFSGTETTTLTRYTGDQLFPVASAQLDCRVEVDDRSFQISPNGITYYNAGSREVIFLDNDLKEVSRLGMSADMVGRPVLSSNRMQVYYCTSDAIRVYDIGTGLDKLLKTIAYGEQTVEDVLLNDSILRCSLVDNRGLAYTIFVSTETGEMRSQILSGADVTTRDDLFYACMPEGLQTLLIFGQVGGDPSVLTPADPFAQGWFLEESNGLITATVTEELTRLDYYDLATGLRTATVELPAGIDPQYAEIQPDTGSVLVMGYDAMGGAPVILSWNKDANPAQDETLYSGPRFTPEDPDPVGLDACNTLARNISDKYGVEVRITWDAIEKQPWDYTFEMEYQTSVIRKQLETLDEVLSRFPEGFFDQLFRKASICIVRSIQGSAESGSVANAQGIQFWDGYNPYVVLAAGDTLEGAFFHEMFHVLDSKILSDTRVYYHWENLNPDGFGYYDDYTTYLEVDAGEYLRDEDRVFIDAYSMCYSREDRARIMEYACQEGNAHYFQSETMQRKLKTLCEGIRAAFKLKDYPDAFLWEQYLKEPLTPNS